MPPSTPPAPVTPNYKVRGVLVCLSRLTPGSSSLRKHELTLALAFPVEAPRPSGDRACVQTRPALLGVSSLASGHRGHTAAKLTHAWQPARGGHSAGTAATSLPTKLCVAFVIVSYCEREQERRDRKGKEGGRSGRLFTLRPTFRREQNFQGKCRNCFVNAESL